MKPNRQNMLSSSSTRNPKLILPVAVDSRQDPPPNRGGQAPDRASPSDRGGRPRRCLCGPLPSDRGAAVAGSRRRRRWIEAPPSDRAAVTIEVSPPDPGSRSPSVPKHGAGKGGPSVPCSTRRSLRPHADSASRPQPKPHWSAPDPSNSPPP
jgi:hypothetical protein